MCFAVKKTYIIFLLILFCAVLGSCKHRETYRFLNSENQISDISIVSITFDTIGDVIQTEVQRIEDKDAFLDNFRRIHCYTYYGDPTGVTEEGVEATVIKVLYKNGEYELINWSGQAEYTSENGFNFYRGYSVFDKTEFDLLMDKYLSG